MAFSTTSISVVEGGATSSTNVTLCAQPVCSGAILPPLCTEPAEPRHAPPAFVVRSDPWHDTHSRRCRVVAWVCSCGPTPPLFPASPPTQTANVTVSLSLLNTSIASVSPASLTFTSADWNVPQSAAVQGINNGVVDGTKTTRLSHSTTSADTKFTGLSGSTVNVTVYDAAQVRGAQGGRGRQRARAPRPTRAAARSVPGRLAAARLQTPIHSNAVL